MFSMTTASEVNELMHQARCQSALKGWATRRVRLWLDRLYALEDPRG